MTAHGNSRLKGTGPWWEAFGEWDGRGLGGRERYGAMKCGEGLKGGPGRWRLNGTGGDGIGSEGGWRAGTEKGNRIAHR